MTLLSSNLDAVQTGWRAWNSCGRPLRQVHSGKIKGHTPGSGSSPGRVNARDSGPSARATSEPRLTSQPFCTWETGTLLDGLRSPFLHIMM